jgi:CRISPR-associated protein Csm4
MPTLTPYHLIFKGGLHLGTHGADLEEAAEFVPSDTLFAALLDVWNRLGGDVAAFVAPFDGEKPKPPFLLTSAFPYAGGVRFFPIPADLKRLFSARKLEDENWRKSLKRIRYLSQGLLEKALAGHLLDDDLFPLEPAEEPKKGVALQGGVLWLLSNEVSALPSHFQTVPGSRLKRPLKALRYLSLWQMGEVPRVTVDRIVQASTLYHAGRVTFAEGCGLWFGLHWINRDETLGAETYAAAFQRCLNSMQDDGLGGERSSGYGAFEYREKPSFSLADAQKGEAAYLLSRYHPNGGELPQALDDNRAAYVLVNIGGWVHTLGEADQRRRRLWMVEAGSLIIAQGEMQGSLEDVQPNYENPDGDLSHPVWRYGLALPVGWPVEVKHG